MARISWPKRSAIDSVGPSGTAGIIAIASSIARLAPSSTWAWSFLRSRLAAPAWSGMVTSIASASRSGMSAKSSGLMNSVRR